MEKNAERLTETPWDSGNLQEGIDLVELMLLVGRRWKFILLIVLLTVLGGGLFSQFKPKIYEAEVILMVSGDQIYSAENLENDDILKNQRLVPTYSEIAKSKSIMLGVIDNLDLEMSYDEISSSLRMEPIEETELIKIAFRNKNPQKASSIANEISKELIKKINEVMSFKNLRIVEKAIVPEKAINDKKAIAIVASILLGSILGVSLCLINESLYGKVRKSQDIEKILGCQVIANIPKTKKSKGGNNRGSQ